MNKNKVLLVLLSGFLGMGAIAQTNGTTGVSGGTQTLSPTFQSIRDSIFVPKCLTCHAAGQSAEDVPIGDYARLIADGSIVVAGDLAKSSLVDAISGAVPEMPPKRSGLPAVTAAELTTIKLWIQNGAVEQ